MIPITANAGKKRRFPWVMVALLMINLAVFGFQIASPGGEDLSFDYGLVPYRLSHPRYYGGEAFLLGIVTLITATFLHGSLLHVGVNMVFLFVFGDSLEDRLGHWRFLTLYTAAGLAGNLAHAIVLADSHIPTIGASGAIAGVLGAYLWLFPKAGVRSVLLLGPYVIYPHIPIPAFVLIGFWALLQLLPAIAILNPLLPMQSQVAYWTHVGGFLAGLAMAAAARGTAPRSRPRATARTAKAPRPKRGTPSPS